MNISNNNDEETKNLKLSNPVKPSTEGTIFRSVSMSTTAPRPQRFREDSSKVLQKSHSSPGPPQDHTPTSSVWVWKMINQLHPVPMYHPLERTAVTIENLSLDTVTARVSKFMKNQSITCSYHSDSGRVNCLTGGLLKFVVQLWQGAGSVASNKVITMEVQRRDGCCFEMQGLRNQLIRAILSGESSQPKTKQPQTSCEFLQTLLKTTTAASLPPPPPRKDCLSTALEVCRRFLESKRLDENRLGLESLCILTDPSKVLAKDAYQASRIILSDSSFQDLLEKFFFDMELTHNEPTDDDDDAVMDYGQGQFFGCLHILATKTLSNALESVARNDQSSRLSIDLSSLFWQTVLQSLYYNLKKAPRRQLEACLSTRCLRLLLTLEPFTLKMAPSQHHLHEYLLNAHQYGREHSRSLEQETEQLMGRLGFVH